MTVSPKSYFRLIGQPDPPPLPVYPWRTSGLYAITPTNDIYGWMSTLVTALNAEGVYWGVNFSDLVGGAQSVEVKRIGSPPSGELSSVRVLFYGSTTGVGAGVLDGDANLANVCYMSLCLDANSGAGGPATAFTAGDPYTGFISNSKGFQSVSGIVASSYLWFAESEIGFVLNLHQGSTNAAKCSFFGRVWDDFTGTPGWVMCANPNATTTLFPLNTTSPYQITACATGVNTRMIGMKSGSSTRYDIGRVSDGPSCANGIDDSGLYGGAITAVFIGGRVRGSGSPYESAGKLHQFRYGPTALDLTTTTDGVGIPQTIYVGGSSSVMSPGFHLDLVRA